ncbi:tyrosine-type recombinase/integrase [Ralstonia pseudosolanacearum]|uniref:tyrosine-type recombinase/integrase n=1 Tax=Ralstonia pseudosolanacearum TaxID=1310165 RepID=UPI001E4A1769|nr:tyrosine-type recombinase/integrase [Ralstonia pseudosolanacearum]
MNAPTLTPIAAAAPGEAACQSFFPAEMTVSYDTAGGVASRFGDLSWNLSSMSTDGTSVKTLHFWGADNVSASGLRCLIRDQQKALIWLYMDAGKTRAWTTLQNTNLALNAWCEKAADKGVDLYTLLTNPEWVAEGALDMNTPYVFMTSAVLKTLWRHRQQLGAPADLQFQKLRDTLCEEARSRPETRQTPLIPSRVYCAILAALGDRMGRVERELDALLDAYARDRAASRNTSEDLTKHQRERFRYKALGDAAERMKGLGYKPAPGTTLDRFIAGRLAEHQLALMLVVAAYTGMRVGEASILPLDDVLLEFEHMGATHYEVQGSTHKLNKGVKRATTWITSHQGARAVLLAQRIARVIQREYGKPPKAGQQALLFPSTGNPYKSMADVPFQRGLTALRGVLCPVIEQSDIDELDRLELARGWERDGIAVGKRWPLAFHQLRRSLAVYAHRSGMVSLPALKAQLQHITQEMTAYYADGFSRAVNLVFDKKHFSHEWQAAKAESSYFAYAFGVLFSDEDLLGRGAQRMASTVESRSRQDTLRLFEENKLAYRETPLGGCVSTEACKTDPLEPIPYDCLETNCVNLVVFGKRLDHVIKFQEVAVATLERDEAGSVEHRLEARHLEVLLKARERLQKGAW